MSRVERKQYNPNGPVLNVSEDIQEIEKLLQDIHDTASLRHKHTKHIDAHYYEIPAAFDIETSSFYSGEEKQAIMYHWQFGIDGTVIFGRTWYEYEMLISRINSILTTEDRVLIVYIHNFAFEFQWLKDRHNWSRTFSTAERKVIYATTSGIEFRCSYILTGMKLEKMAQNCRKYPCEKKVGDLDYRLVRTPESPLSEAEKGYCEADVRVIMNYIQEQIEMEGSITKIPLTKTGYVRRYCRNACFSSKDDNKMWEYKHLMKKLTMTMDEYHMARRAFQGGFTHANPMNALKELKDVSSFDFSSSYPFCLMLKYPMSKGRLVQCDNSTFEKYLKTNLCIFDIQLNGVKMKDDAPDSYISFSKCWDSKNAKSQNGRVYEADSISLTITNIDLEIIKRIYDVKTYRQHNLWIYKADYLPRPLLKAILELYKNKTELKNVEGMEVEYLLAKELLNSVYGCMAQEPLKPEAVYDGEWDTRGLDETVALDEYNKNTRRFIFYPWAVFCTAYARMNLFSGLLSVGKKDHIYSDTDSMKILNKDAHMEYINNYNAWVDRQLERMCKARNLDYSMTRPKTVEGKEKPLGWWDYEGTYTRFKTLGAKRYMTEDADGVYSLTVSGLNKETAIPYLLSKYGKDGIFGAFNSAMKVPAEWEVNGKTEKASGRTTHSYIDWETEGDVIDYLGKKYHYKEKSSIHIENSSYSMEDESPIAQAYFTYLAGIQIAYID